MKDANRFQRVIAVAVPVLLALALAAVCIWASAEQRKAEARAQSLETMVQANYRQAFYELSDNVNDIQNTLKKLRVTNSPSRHVQLLADVYRLSGAAVANMGSVPRSHVDAAELNSFIVRVGDYANVLTKRILNGGVLTQEDYDQLDSLFEASVQINNDLSDRMARDDFPIASLTAEGYYASSAEAEAAGEGGGQDGAAEARAGGTEEGNTPSTGAQEDKESISDYPTLIYDGPFSQSNEEAAPRGLPQGEIDEESARKLAVAFLGGGALTGTGLEEGTIPVYGFYGKDASDRNVELTVTRQGGAVLWMMAETPAGADGVPDEATVTAMRDAARTYLTQHGYADMEPTYAQFYDGIGVFNFAATQHDVILYNDLIKVYVERASATVCGVDANNYLMMHIPRTITAPLLSRDEAAQLVSEALTMQSVRLALIPKTAATEVLCYEFKGVCREAAFIVYINAATGAEEDIFEIIDAEDGQLVV